MKNFQSVALFCLVIVSIINTSLQISYDTSNLGAGYTYENKGAPSTRTAACHDTNVVDYALRLMGCNNEIANQAGRLEVYYKDSWGTVCKDSFNLLGAQVACYSLGYMRFEGLLTGDAFPMGEEGVSIVLDDLECNGNETVLDECNHAEWAVSNCNHREDVTIACAMDTSNPLSKYGYQTRLVNDVDSNVTNAGRLEIFHRGEWGTVCDDGWSGDSTNFNARIACRALGQGYQSGVFLNNEYGKGSGRIWLDSVSCQGDTERNVGNCAHEPWGVHDCNHDEDVAVYCGQCFDEYCENNSTCLSEDIAGCVCLPGYTGVYCETQAQNCNQAECLNGGSCVFQMGQFRCNCAIGYTGRWCETRLGLTSENWIQGHN